jgi:hypothetical protein
MSGFGQVLDIKEDLTHPIQCVPIYDSELPSVHEAARVYNQQVLGERELKGRRTKVRVSFEGWTRSKGGPMSYMRLRENHIVLSCPNARQANAAIELIRSVCKQLDGKFLAEPEQFAHPTR